MKNIKILFLLLIIAKYKIIKFIKIYYKIIIFDFIIIIFLDFLYTKYFNEQFNILRNIKITIICLLVSLKNYKK